MRSCFPTTRRYDRAAPQPSQGTREPVKSVPTRHILVIVNPAAGGGRGVRRFETLRGVMELWHGRLRVRTTSKRGDAERLATKATADGVSMVVAVGGDGTVHEVVNGILATGSDARPALAVVPVGTGCDFARSLGLPPRASAAEPRRRVSVDVGRVRCTTGDGRQERFFLNAANMGASTAAARRIKDSRLLKRAGVVAYVAAGLPEVIVRPTTRFVVAEQGAEERTEYLVNLSVCNGPRFGGGLTLAPRANLFDGTLHLAQVGRGSLVSLLRTLSAGYSQPLHTPRGVQVRRVTGLTVDGDAAIEVDGEIPGRLPAEFTVLPRALEVLLP